MTKNILLFAGIILAVLFLIGCGGDGVVPTTPAPPTPQTEYRLTLIEGWQGGVATTSIAARQGVMTPFEVRYDFRTASMGGNWSPVAQDSTLDVTIEGAPSGYKIPDIGLSGGQYRLRTGTCRLEFFPPVGGQTGSTWLVLKVRESGAALRASITILPPLIGPPPPPPSCRDLHPTREAIGGFWWDCINGVWMNTEEPVNPPPPPPPPPITYTFHVRGAQGDFSLTKYVSIDEGNGYIFDDWELWGSDGSKVSLDPSNAQMASLTLPDWAWHPGPGGVELTTFKNPGTLPGNQYIQEGCWDITLEYTYQGKQYSIPGDVEVNHVEGYPPID